MADIQGWKEFMAQIAPMLYRQKMQKGQMETWLQNALKQYAASEASSKRLGQTRFDQSKIMELIKAGGGGVEGKPRPEQLLALVLKEMGIGVPGITDVTRESYGKAIEPEVGAMRQIAISRGAGEYPPDEALGQIAGVLGEESVADFLDDLFKEKGRTEGLEFDREKLAATLSGQDIEKGRQEIERGKLEAEKGGKGEKKLTELSKMLTVYNKQEEILETKILEASTAEEEDALNAKLTPLQEKKDAVIAKMEEQFPSIDKLSKALNLFRGEGITAKALEMNKEAVKKEYKLSEEEFQYIKAQL